MGKYSIKELEKLSGIKAHTLRIWEKRYDLIETKRTDTNIRYYDDEDLKYILNIAYLVNHGLKISKAADLTKEEAAQHVLELSESREDYEYEINSFIMAMVDLDEARFEKNISTYIIKYGIERTVVDILYPFLDRIGIMWMTGSINPAQEHFISNLIRQKLILATDGLVIRDPALTKKYLLFLPEGELHELGLLFANYIIRSRNNHTLYLGQSVPFSDLEATYDYYQPDYLFTIITNSITDEELEAYCLKLAKRFKKSKVLVSGKVLDQIKFPAASNLIFIKDVKATIDFIEGVSKVA